ncbi:MAG: RNA polymerase sigma factor [Bacteroidetes bacterium]|nr:RNA polymerase sigma factor [Bacteroidota bacterium]
MEEFLKLVEKKAFRMIQIATGDTDDALDLLQDSMMKFVNNYAKKPESEWKPLFYKVVQNRIKDWFRREKLKNLFFTYIPGVNKKESENQPDPIQLAMDHKTPDSIAIIKTSQAMEKLDIVLNKLPPRQQQVFLLRAWEGLSTKETATAMTCTQGTVKTHYFRAINTLKQELKGIWP